MVAGKKNASVPKPVRHSRGRPPLDDSERLKILDATAEVFLENGFAHSSTSEIARRARTSKQTLYRLFPTKADLFVGVIGSHTSRLFARHIEFVQSDKPPRANLNEMGNLMLGLFTDPGFLALYRIIVGEAHSFPELARELWLTGIGRGYGLLAGYLKSRRIGGPSYRRSAEQFFSFVLGDFLVNAMLNPDARLSRRALQMRVRAAVDDFLRLHPEGAMERQA